MRNMKFLSRRRGQLGLLLIITTLLLLARPWAKEEAQGSASRFYQGATCESSDPGSVQAWSGCWKLGPAQKAPSEENLFLRMKVAEEGMRIGLHIALTGSFTDFQKPHLCKVGDRYTLAPERNLDFKGRFTQVYEMHDQPIREWRRIMGNQYKKQAEEFLKRGGKYVRTWIVSNPNQVWWDDDAEEDMWALPVACSTLEQVPPGPEGEMPAGPR